MTSTDIFGGIPDDPVSDPDRAATALGDILSFFHGEAMGGPAISQGIGTQTAGTQTTTTTSGTATGEGNGTDRAAPVPEGTGVSGAYLEDRGGRQHPGIDLSVPVGSQILAANSGTVTHAADDDPSGYGTWVEITGDDGIITRYGHLSGMNVTVGTRIRAGQVIGASGGAVGAPGSGSSTGAHLHFEVRQNGGTIDPTPFLAGGYSILGGVTSDTSTTTPADPNAIAAVQLQNVVNVLGGQPAQDATPQQVASDTASSTPSTGNYARDILAGIGAPSTSENIRLMEAWIRAEGTDPSNFNPLATTQGAEGDRTLNSHGVRGYNSYEQGLQATIQTLLNGYYGPIIEALKAGNNALAVADAIAASPWGTGGLVKQILQEG